MRKKVVSFILTSLFLFSIVSGSFTIEVFATPGILHVPSQYSTVQAAINAANSGDTIQVAHGIYNESIIIDRTISLIGENPSNTVIDGSGTQSDTIRIDLHVNNVKIEGFTIQDGGGVEPACLRIGNSKGHTIRNNIIRQSHYGLRMAGTNDSYIVNNVIANNTVIGLTAAAGIYLSSSSRNKVIGNTIQKNAYGVWVADNASQNNVFYHNNFIDNTNQARSLSSMNFWSNGAEGNYWSDNESQDLNGDGICDTNDCDVNACIPFLSLDFFPLIDKWSDTRGFPFWWKGVPYNTVISRNSTIASFNFSYSLALISFNVTGPQNTVGFFNVTIDKSFLDGNFTVFVDRVSIQDYVSTHNSTHTFLYFTLRHSTHKVQIKGTKVIGNPIPIANFTYSPTDPKENQEIQFNDTSTDLNGVTDWLWDFGDGNISSQQNPIYRYMQKGTYNVTLTVKDSENATNTITKTIVVSASLPDYTLYYVLVGIVSGALILGAALFLLKKKKKPSSSTKTTE